MSRKVPTKKIIEELKSIIEYSKIFNKVDIGVKKSLTQEDIFPSCYIKVDGVSVEDREVLSVSKGCEYDRYIIVRFLIHLNMEDDLEFLDYQDSLEKAIITDNPLWKFIVNRDFIGSEWDSDTSYPKKEGELAFLIRWRSNV